MDTRLADFVEGVFVEVLWDVERLTVEGRRQGERVVESVWWKVEIVEVKRDEGKTTAKIKYDPLGDFNTQIGEVHVFPGHVLVNDEGDTTQLRWRYYESSGDVSYRHDGTDCDKNDDVMCAAASIETGGSMRNKLEEVLNRVEEVERIVVSQGGVFSRQLKKVTHEQHCHNRIFALLRQKLAAAVQKPLVAYKQRNDNKEAAETLFDFSCAGSLRVQVDCTVEEFENICAVVRSVIPSASFRVDGNPFVPVAGCLLASRGVAEILFASLSQLCEGIGICQERDFMCIARRERKQGKKGGSEDAAIRVAGSFLVDGDADDTPSAILVCRGLHEGVPLEQRIDFLSRENRELDTRTVWYSQPLCSRNMTLSSLLRFIFPKTFATTSDFQSKAKQIARSTEMSSFALRWKPLPNPNAKLWSRSMLLRPDFAGILELEIPYVLIRGVRGIKETNELITSDYIKNQLP